MTFVIVAGTPGSGKTSILLHAIKELKIQCRKVAVVKIDCLHTDDKRRFERHDIPVKVGISQDMCPDHFAIYNTQDMVEWGLQQGCDVLIVETAGLCLRCSPYTDKCLAICMVDVTGGPNVPLKIGPLLTTADVVVATKGDLVSQAEREVFRERIYEINKNCSMIDANGLSGKGAAEIVDVIMSFEDVPLNDMVLRHTPPLAICTLCTGEKRVAKNLHCGVLRSLEGFEKYEGE